MLASSDVLYVCQLAQEAGDLAARMRAETTITQKSADPLDLVTAADAALSELIVKRLRDRFPNDIIISEEDPHAGIAARGRNLWFVDPIDGTENYVANDGQYSVMIGYVVDDQPVFGCIYAPALGETYYGGPDYGVWRICANKAAEPVPSACEHDKKRTVRLMMGTRDRKSHPWVDELPVEWVHSGSVGLRVARIIFDEADLYVHLSAKLKTWDTAGPLALARAGGLEVIVLSGNNLTFANAEQTHPCQIAIGRPGLRDWSVETMGPKRTLDRK